MHIAYLYVDMQNIQKVEKIEENVPVIGSQRRRCNIDTTRGSTRSKNDERNDVQSKTSGERK